MSYKPEYQEDEQFVRRAFDAIYDFSPAGVSDFFKRIPRKFYWMAVSVVASLVLIVIAWQFASAGVESYQWSQRTPLRERLMAPYGLDQRQIPNIDLSTVTLAELPKVNSAALEADRAAAVALAGEQWLSQAQQAYEAALAAGEVITPETAEALTAAAQAEAIAAAEALAAERAAAAESVVIQVGADGAEEVVVEEIVVEPVVVDMPRVATVNDFMPADFDEAAIRASIQPAYNASYFRVLPELPNYLRTYIYDNVTSHPTLSCLTTIEVEAAASCGVKQLPVYIEAADYADPENAISRVVVARYETAEAATASIAELRRYSGRVGNLGNYSIAPYWPVKYFYATGQNWHTFIWSQGEWVYSVSSRSGNNLEAIVGGLPF